MRSCLSPLQAGRKHFDEKLWNGKNETKFDNQHLWQTYEPTDKYSLAFSGSSQLFHRSNSTSQGILIVE